MRLPFNVHPLHRIGRRRLQGMTYIEMTIALTIVAGAALACASMQVSSLRLDSTNRESAAAFAAATSELEFVCARPFDRIVPTFNTDATDDPDGAGTAPGRNFTQPQFRTLGTLAPVTAEVLVPAIGTALREDAVIPELGLPADLNGDGAIDALDHARDAILLPVAVRLRWTGANGARQYVLATRVWR